MAVASIGSSAGADSGAVGVLKTVGRIIVELGAAWGAARRVSIACENGRRPLAADLATLGIPADGLPRRW